MTQIPQVRLSDGHQMPQLGFGTWDLNGKQAERAVTRALEVGYRHLDMATLYANEAWIGRALETTLTDLGVDHLDLYLIHSPGVRRYGNAYITCWDALQEFRDEGLTTSIGVSNFTADHIAALHGMAPVVNQVELHPTYSQPELRAQMADREIAVVSYSPLGQASDLTDQVVQQIAETAGRTPAQVVLRWHLQHGLTPIPKSSHPQRIADNLDVFDFELSREQMGLIDSLNRPDVD